MKRMTNKLQRGRDQKFCLCHITLIYSIHHLETEVRLNENMCIFNVFKMYSVILFFFCKVNTTYLKFENFLVVVLYPRHIIM